MKAATETSVLCFGEILWDFLPDGLFPGGAPFNVAYHLHRHRTAVHVVSAVGKDLLGDELLRRLAQWGLPVQGVIVTPNLPTGYVRASLGPAGDAHYEIIRHVAWDQISPSDSVTSTAKTADAIVFGSLAQRSAYNRTALRHLLKQLPASALRIFDVNLRAPHDDPAVVNALAAEANVLKVNSDEAARLTGGSNEPGQEETNARRLALLYKCPLTIVTAGARGAGMLRNNSWYWEAGHRIKVADTIGAGDAFLASFVAGLLNKQRPYGEILARACRLGEWVASERGATPAYEPATPA